MMCARLLGRGYWRATPPTAAAIPVKTAARAWWSPFGAIDGVHLVHVDSGFAAAVAYEIDADGR